MSRHEAARWEILSKIMNKNLKQMRLPFHVAQYEKDTNIIQANEKEQCSIIHSVLL